MYRIAGNFWWCKFSRDWLAFRRNFHILIFYGVVFGWGNGERLPCLQGYLGYCCQWGITMPAWRWQQSRSFRCSGSQRGGHRWPCSKEDIICLLYLPQGGSIVCQLTGSRHFSGDLVQGGLEIPCVLVFEGDAEQTASFASFITKGLTDEDKRPLGSGRASRGCKYRYNAISFTLCARIKILMSSKFRTVQFFVV